MARGLDRLLIATTALLAGGTALLLLVPDLHFLVVKLDLDLILSTVSTFTALLVAVVAWGRDREEEGIASAYEAGAFFVLAAAGALPLLGIVLGAQERLGMEAADPGQQLLYLWGIARFIAAVMLVLASRAVLDPIPPRLTALQAALAPAAVFALVAAVIVIVGPSLPPLVDPLALSQGATAPFAGGVLSAGFVAQTPAVVLFLYAAVLQRRRFLRGEGASTGVLAIAFVVAAFSQLHFAIVPGVHPALVTSGDILRTVFSALVLWSGYLRLRTDLRRLRSANIELVRLRDADAARATLEERARLARELHDGLAQNLWLAKLKAARLTDPEANKRHRWSAVRELEEAIDEALAETRQAVAALRVGSVDGAFSEAIRRHVDDWSRRSSIPATVVVDGPAATLPARTQAELLRLMQEALSNVQKHARAGIVTVHAEEDARRGFRLSIDDDGCGFAPASVDGRGFGLLTMRERVESIGGSLQVVSAAGNGTRIVATVPLEEVT